MRQLNRICPHRWILTATQSQCTIAGLLFLLESPFHYLLVSIILSLGEETETSQKWRSGFSIPQPCIQVRRDQADTLSQEQKYAFSNSSLPIIDSCQRKYRSWRDYSVLLMRNVCHIISNAAYQNIRSPPNYKLAFYRNAFALIA